MILIKRNGLSMLGWARKILPFVTYFNIHKRYRRRSSLIKIEAAKAYVFGVKKIRFFLLGVLFVFFSFVLLASGLLLIHMALFIYSNWSVQTKFFVALVLGCLEVFAASGILFYLLREETWIKFSGINRILKSVLNNESEYFSSRPQSSQNKEN